MRTPFLPSMLLALVAGFSLPSVATAMVTELAPVTVTAAPARLNINNVDAQTLQRELDGIGKAKAEAIVAYREAHGNFAAVDELLEIKGIGKALLERNRERLTAE